MMTPGEPVGVSILENPGLATELVPSEIVSTFT